MEAQNREEWLNRKIKLGKTDLYAGRIGIGASYGVPANAIEAAFEEGCNYFYWGALRNAKMATAIRNIVSKGKRSEMIVVIQNFRRSRRGVEHSLIRGLEKLGLDYADVLLLGWYKNPPNPDFLETLEKLKEKQAFRYLGISGHKRTLFPELAKDPRYDLFQIRYNAANRGAEEDVFPHLPENRPGIVAFTATRRMSLVKSNRIPADEKRPTAGDCYRFVLTNPSVDVVITGPSNAAQLEENLAGVKKGPLSEDELAWMRRIGDYVYGRT
jgi:aryl-alcohol dehydrogenase-like predicted oxidoreductase